MGPYLAGLQSRSVALVLLGGLLLVAGVAIAYWSFRLSLSRREPGDPDAPREAFPDGIEVGSEPLPLLVILVIAGVLAWGTVYGILAVLGAATAG